MAQTPKQIAFEKKPPPPVLEAVSLLKTKDGYTAMRIKAHEYEVIEKSEPNLLIIARDYLERYVRRLLNGGSL